LLSTAGGWCSLLRTGLSRACPLGGLLAARRGGAVAVQITLARLLQVASGCATAGGSSMTMALVCFKVQLKLAGRSRPSALVITGASLHGGAQGCVTAHHRLRVVCTVQNCSWVLLAVIECAPSPPFLENAKWMPNISRLPQATEYQEYLAGREIMVFRTPGLPRPVSGAS